jgi:hypothetical protein
MAQTFKEQQINRAAAWMAVSNMGLPLDRERFLRWTPPKRYTNSPRSEIEDFAGHLMESEEHEDTFVGEAESWARQITVMGGIEKFLKTFTWQTEVLSELLKINAE